jgi:hypothetical protein
MLSYRNLSEDDLIRAFNPNFQTPAYRGSKILPTGGNGQIWGVAQYSDTDQGGYVALYTSLVMVDPDNFLVACSCTRSELDGIICGHITAVLRHNDYQLMPPWFKKKSPDSVLREANQVASLALLSPRQRARLVELRERYNGPAREEWYTSDLVKGPQVIEKIETPEQV